MAEQDSRLVTWDASHLRHYLTCDSHLSAVLDLIIGNDVASKLYSTKSRPRHVSAVRVPATRSLPLQLNAGDSHRPGRSFRARPDRPEQLPLKLRWPSFVGECLEEASLRFVHTRSGAARRRTRHVPRGAGSGVNEPLQRSSV